MAAGEGIVCAYDRTQLVKHGGHIEITKTWAMSLLKRMGYVKRKATTKRPHGISEEDFKNLKANYLHQIMQMVKLYNIPDSLITNLDETGIKLVPTGDWTMAAEGSRKVEMAGLCDKRQITATFMASLDGTFLRMQLLYQEKLTILIQSMLFLKNSTSFTPPIIGPMNKPVFATLKKYLFHM